MKSKNNSKLGNLTDKSQSNCIKPLEKKVGFNE